MSSPCHRRHVVPMSSQCRRHAVAIWSPCRRHVVAMPSRCCHHAMGMSSSCVVMPSPFAPTKLATDPLVHTKNLCPQPSRIYLNYITLHSLHSLYHHKCNCNHTTVITLHHSYNSTTLQLQLQLRYATLHPAVVGEVTDQVTAATIATTPRSTAPTTFSVHQWIRSAIRDSQQPTSPIASYL